MPVTGLISSFVLFESENDNKAWKIFKSPLIPGLKLIDFAVELMFSAPSTMMDTHEHAPTLPDSKHPHSTGSPYVSPDRSHSRGDNIIRLSQPIDNPFDPRLDDIFVIPFNPWSDLISNSRRF